MFSNNLKFILGGIATASVISAGLYFTLPKDYQEVRTPVKAQDTDYERSIYGVPNLKLHHYRLNDDNYFDLVLDGSLNVGRTNPAALNTWYNRLVKNPKLATTHLSLRERIEAAMKESDSPELIDTLESILAEEAAKQKAKEDQLAKLKEAKEQAALDKELADAEKTPDESTQEGDSTATPPTTTTDSDTDKATPNSTDNTTTNTSTKDTDNTPADATTSTKAKKATEDTSNSEVNSSLDELKPTTTKKSK